jgi:prepilin-type N-terminal cleavage/methylation domain-containing protein
MKRRKSGFTLIEILIVVIIIGILAGSILIISKNMISKAEATKIVSNLESLKKAVLFYYADNNEWFSQSEQGWGVISVNVLAPYLDREMPEPYSISGLEDWDSASKNPYFIYVSGPGSTGFSSENLHIYVAANVTNDYVDYETRKQLERMSPEMKIYDGSLSENLDNPSLSIFVADEDPNDVGSKGSVIMRVK